MAHLPVVLLRELFDALNDLLVVVLVSRSLIASFLFAFGACGGAKSGGRSGEMATAEGRPLWSVSESHDELASVRRRTGIRPTPVSLQNLFISRSSSR
jgi:hypothetical protein